MSYPRKRHASMMESQKKAAEEAAASALNINGTSSSIISSEQPVATVTSASVQHADFDSSSDDSDSDGIAFLSTTTAGAKKSRSKAAALSVAAATLTNPKTGSSSANAAASSSTAAAAAAVMSLNRMHWTKEMDALLLHIVPIYDAKDWVSIAKHMGGEVTNEQCRNRWCCKVDPALHACKTGAWEPEEEAHMRELIQQFTNHPEQDKRGRRRYRDSVHWGAVAKELNRSQKDCRSKWTTLQRSVVIQELKKGPFTPEEDALVMQRVAEWGDKGQGIWKALEQELGRPSNNIGNRYRKLVKTYASGASEDGAPLLPGTNVDNYMEVSSERKLAAVLAPVGGSMGSADLSDAAVREAAITAAMLAGKRRGRPRTNPLPLSLDVLEGMTGDAVGSRYGTGKRSRDGDAEAEDCGLAGSAASVPVLQGSSNTAAASSERPDPSLPINASAELAAGRTKIGRSSFWNEERDALLVEAMALYGKDWGKICAHVGEGANTDRCWQRWNRYLKPEAMVCKTDPWTTEELIRLEELVLTHINNPNKRRAGRSTSRATIDWTSISQLMERPYMDCKGKWKKVKAFSMKKGPFTEEEDALIMQQVAELGVTVALDSTASTSGPDGEAETTSGVAGEPQQQAGAEATIVYPSGFWDELSAALNRPPEMLRARVRNIRARGYVGME